MGGFFHSTEPVESGWFAVVTVTVPVTALIPLFETIGGL
jgi:hypothetical protein